MPLRPEAARALAEVDPLRASPIDGDRRRLEHGAVRPLTRDRVALDDVAAEPVLADDAVQACRQRERGRRRREVLDAQDVLARLGKLDESSSLTRMNSAELPTSTSEPSGFL
jgi:hypothetical protein